MLAGNLALMVAALFTGAAFYVSFAEQPARLGLDDRALLAQWKPAYKRGFAMQAPLAVAGFVLGTVAWWLTGSLAFFIGGVLLLANWPWTIFGIMPMLYDAYSIPASYRFLILFLEIISTRTGSPKHHSVARLHKLTYSVRTI